MNTINFCGGSNIVREIASDAKKVTEIKNEPFPKLCQDLAERQAKKVSGDNYASPFAPYKIEKANDLLSNKAAEKTYTNIPTLPNN